MNPRYFFSGNTDTVTRPAGLRASAFQSLVVPRPPEIVHYALGGAVWQPNPQGEVKPLAPWRRK